MRVLCVNGICVFCVFGARLWSESNASLARHRGFLWSFDLRTRLYISLSLSLSLVCQHRVIYIFCRSSHSYCVCPFVCVIPFSCHTRLGLLTVSKARVFFVVDLRSSLDVAVSVCFWALLNVFEGYRILCSICCRRVEVYRRTAIS